MTKPMLKLVPQDPPPIDILQVPRSTPTRLPNAAYRSREYLTPTEMDALLELGKLSAVAWLGHQRSSSSWGLKASITILVLVLMTLNAVGAFGFLSKAHIASALAGDLAVAGRSADTEARLSMQAGEDAEALRPVTVVSSGGETAARRRGAAVPAVVVPPTSRASASLSARPADPTKQR